MMIRAVLVLGLVVALEACALGDVRGTHRIVPTQGPDSGITLDMALVDAGLDPLMSPPDSFQRQILLVFHADTWEMGFRAHLIPPQSAQAQTISLLQALPEIGVLVPWTGPQSAGQTLLDSVLSSGIRAAPFYDIPRAEARIDEVELASAVEVKINWLVAHVTDSESVLTFEGRPVIGIRLNEEHLGLVGLIQSHLVTLGRDIHLFVQVSSQLSEQPSVEGQTFISQCYERRQPEVTPGQFVCVSPSANRRLEDESARVNRPNEFRFVDAVRWARRKMDSGFGLLVVDGLGAWRDDRQLDPVGGEVTAEPESLTAGYEYTPYGDARWNVIRRLMSPAGSIPMDWLKRGQIEEMSRTNDVVVSSAGYVDGEYTLELRNPGREGHAEFLLDGRPFVIPEGVFLRYFRTDLGLRVQLTLADGRRLSALAADSGLEVSLDLSSFVGLRVEETTLEYTGGFLELSGGVSTIRIER